MGGEPCSKSFMAITAALTVADSLAEGKGIWGPVANYLQLWSIIVPALLAFFAFYLARTDMRDAIAGSFVVVFLIVLVETVVLRLGDFSTTDGTIRGLVLSNFVTLVGTIVIFYFGSEAAIRVGLKYVDARVRTHTHQPTPVASEMKLPPGNELV